MSDLSPTPQAAPPLTIGPFTNVPAPGSPIRSDWTQQITQYVVDRAIPSQGFNAVVAVPFTTIGIRDLLALTIPAVPYPTLITAHAVIGWAGDTSTVSGTPELFRFVDSGIVGMGATTTHAAGSWHATPLIWSWAVPANGDPSYKLRMTLNTFTGTAYVTVQSAWTRYRTTA